MLLFVLLLTVISAAAIVAAILLQMLPVMLSTLGVPRPLAAEALQLPMLCPGAGYAALVAGAVVSRAAAATRSSSFFFFNNKVYKKCLSLAAAGLRLSDPCLTPHAAVVLTNVSQFLRLCADTSVLSDPCLTPV